jgi:hypothetical protein
MESVTRSIIVADTEVAATYRAANMARADARRRDLRRAQADAEAAMADVERDLDQAQRALDAASRPEGLWVAVVMLALVAAAGVLLPLVPLTSGVTQLTMGWRVTFTGLFVLSLVAFFGYMVWELRRIMRPVK